MECKHIENQLSDYIDGQLSDAASADVANHLESCPHCRQAYAEMTRLVGFMREIDTVDEPADLLQNVRRRLEAKPSLWDRARELFAAPAFRVPAAATVVAAILLMVLYVPGTKDVEPIFHPPAVGEMGRDDMVDLTVTLESEKKGDVGQMRENEVKELVDVAGDTQPIHERGGRGEEIAVQITEGELSKKGEADEEMTPAAPEAAPKASSKGSPVGEARDELRSRDAPASGVVPEENAPEVATKPVAEVEEMDEDAAAGVAIAKINVVAAEEMSREQLFVASAVDSAGGEIVEWVYDDQHRLSEVVAEIPHDRLEAFQKKMGEMGEVALTEKPASDPASRKLKSAVAPEPGKDKKTVTVRVRIRR